MELKEYEFSILENKINNLTFDFNLPYGDGRFHKGIDLIGDLDKDNGQDYVLAYEDGIVEKCCNTSTDPTSSKGEEGMGNYVIISHRNNFRTRYQHLELGSVKVTAGQEIKKGDIIGRIGKSGNAAQFHLHFDIAKKGCYKNGMWVPQQGRTYFNPNDFLNCTSSIDDDFEEDDFLFRSDESINFPKNPFLTPIEGKPNHFKLNLSIKIKQKRSE